MLPEKFGSISDFKRQKCKSFQTTERWTKGQAIVMTKAHKALANDTRKIKFLFLSFLLIPHLLYDYNHDHECNMKKLLILKF